MSERLKEIQEYEVEYVEGLVNENEQLQAQVDEYEMLVSMLKGVTAQAHEYFDGNVSAKSVDKFIAMTEQALEQKP